MSNQTNGTDVYTPVVRLRQGDYERQWPTEASPYKRIGQCMFIAFAGSLVIGGVILALTYILGGTA